MAPRTRSWLEGADSPQATASTTRKIASARRRVTPPAYRALSRRRAERAASRFGQLPLELGRRRVAVVDVQCVAVGRHDHGRRQRVDVEPIRKRAVSYRIDLVDAHVAE